MSKWDNFNDPTFIHFFRTGELGWLNFTRTMDDVTNFLGEPEWINKQEESLTVFCYGKLWITFWNQELTLYSLYFKEKGQFPSKLGITWFEPLRTIRGRRFVQLLKGLGIPCQPITGYEGYTFDPKEDGYLIWVEYARRQSENGINGIERLGLEIFFETESWNPISKINLLNGEGVGMRFLGDFY